ncbi:MAG: hypothetical protein IPL67_17780 [Ignavibacteria bacterium]|nr:hypothetical protein [Ignavibacteria bacterium]
MTVGNNQQEVVQLSYLSNDTLFINLNSINLIKKYSGSEGHKPVLTRLGGGDWDKVKARTKKQVKDIARGPDNTLRKKKTEKGHKYPLILTGKRSLKQISCMRIRRISSGQRRSKGRHGIGKSDGTVWLRRCRIRKTGFALRAAFKAVMDNKQVAVLVPTTILAVQHYNTFRDRLTAFAVEVDNITRLRSSKEQKEILYALPKESLTY